MNVLILHQHFNTPEAGGPLRSYFLAKALLERNINVTLVTAHNGKEYRHASVDGIEVYYIPVAYSNLFGFGARIRSYLGFAWKIIRCSGKFAQTDIIYAMSTPLTIAIAARWMRWRYRIPYLFETGDLWPDAPVQLGFLSNHVLIWILKRFEKVTYQNSARVIALSPDQASLIAARTRTPVYLVPNMADTLFFQQTAKILRLERQFQVEGKFVVSYIGSLSYANGLDYFIDVAGECLRSRLPVHFILCGDGNMRESLVQSADKNRLDNLSFVPFQTHDGVRDLMNVTDACLICYRNVPILETGSPHKYFDGLAAGKIIFTNFGGWISREIHAHHCGFALDPLNPASILDPLKSLLRQPEKAEQMKTAARNLAEEKYARTKLTSHFASLFLSGQPRIGIEQKEILGA